MKTEKISILHIKPEDEPRLLEILNKVWGIRSAQVDSQQNEAIISFNDAAGSLGDFEQAIQNLGYETKRVQHDEGGSSLDEDL